MMARLSFRPFRLTVRVWRFMIHTAPAVGGRRMYCVRIGGKVYRMRLGPRNVGRP